MGNTEADGDLHDKMHLMLDEQKSMKKQLERESQLNTQRFKIVESRLDNLSKSVDRLYLDLVIVIQMDQLIYMIVKPCLNYGVSTNLA